MITGFNTDVDFQGITYHVQTEDKGLATPFILSLVYDRGTILASKRSPYEDLVTKGFDEKILTERLQKQHKTICAAIRAGKIEQLKEMTAKDSAARRKQTNQPGNVQAPPTPIPSVKLNQLQTDRSDNAHSAPKTEKTEKPVLPVLPPGSLQTEKPLVQNSANKISVYKGSESPIPKPKYDLSIKSISPAAQINNQTANLTPKIEHEEELIVEAFEIIEEELILPAEAVEIVSGSVVSKTADSKLKLEILGDENFRSGEKKTMSILVHRGSHQNGLSGAQVMVKVLGAAFRPLIFHGKTDQQGIAKVHLQMPLFKQGRAAILIKAMSEGEEIELRRTIKHK